MLDEPCAELDDSGREAVQGTALRWAELGGTVLYAAPGPDQGPPADREVWLRDGRAERAA
jgi:ABC-type transport system involved in cytochrome c biogenesis ATPase subunit